MDTAPRLDAVPSHSGGDLGHTHDAALSIKNLTYDVPWNRGTRTILSDISLSVREGEFVSILGSSGCGKSTLLNIVAGFVRPTKGEIRCRGKVVTHPDAERGFVFQKPALYPWLSVIENVLFGPKALGKDKSMRDQARALLDEVGLAGYERRRIYELSGGMQHRVAIVRTLINEPKVLLMDEPFAALDAQTRTEMQEMLLTVWQRHRATVLFVTHDIEEGLLLGDRVVVMASNPGRISKDIEVGVPRPRQAEDALSEQIVELRRDIRTFLKRDRSNHSAAKENQ